MPPKSEQILNRENIPDGGAIIVPNRFSFNDLLHLEKILGERKPVYLVEKSGALDPRLHAHLERDGIEALVFSIDREPIEDFRKALHAKVAADHLVVFVPGRTQTRPGYVTSVPSGVLEYVLSAGEPVLPLFIDHPVDTRLQIEDVADTDFVVIAFGRLLERESATLASYQESLLAAGEVVFSCRPVLKKHLAYAVLQGLKHHGSRSKVVDGFDDGEMRFDKLLGVAIVIAKHIRKATNKKRIGIVLPPGRAGVVANVAALLAGKIPVNLNFTAGTSAVESAIRQADLDHIITVDAFIRKNQNFPWPPVKDILFLERIIPLSKARILVWFMLGKIFSAAALASLLRIPKEAEGEAVLLFTSGSSGEPKGVPLTHRNILANVTQFGARINLHLEDSLLACLPLFHSMGSTVTLWYPIIEGIDMVTYPSPLESGKLAELVQTHHVNLIVATPTFLRGYLRKAKREQLASTRLVVTGAEKLPLKTAEAFEERFGKPVLEGYGLTETSPVSNVNLPDLPPDPADPSIPVMPNTRLGSVGQMLPGIAVRITDPETGAPVPLRSSGMIWLKGANIFDGYLDRPDLTQEVLQDGWFRTGDIGRIDDDGFLYIEGRVSRFSKIAGEMVPHETIEHAITKELDVDTDHERKVAVVGVPDEAKGEQLVLLAALEGLDLTDLRYRLLEAGMASLWIPKTVIKVDAIPILASGKLDIKACEIIARAAK